jgi:hypothetical protein
MSASYAENGGFAYRKILVPTNENLRKAVFYVRFLIADINFDLVIAKPRLYSLSK